MNKVTINIHYQRLLVAKGLWEIQPPEHDKYWLAIALIAYLIGAIMEGVNIISQLFYSASALDNATPENLVKSDPPSQLSWQIIATITSVSICGAFCWPCRLFHRSIRWAVDNISKILF